MKFRPNTVYCIHNTGNNFGKIVFSERNKTYFRKKVLKFIAPFAKIEHISLQLNQFFIIIETKKDTPLDLLNKNIGIMLGSYAKGVNKEQNRLGSLFRKGTKAYQYFSDFPKYIRRKFKQFRKFLEPSRLVKFKESTILFFTALDKNIKSRNVVFAEAELYELLAHPKGYFLEEYAILLKRMIKT